MDEEPETVRVLYVDDEPDFAETFAESLEQEWNRINVATATNVTDGLEIVSDGGIDCVVSDYHMAGRNGLDFLETVRESNPGLPFIVYTQTGDEQVASEVISAGVTDYIVQHPIDPEYELVGRRILAYVREHRLEREREQTRRQLQAFADATDDVFWIFSPDWSEVEFINESYEEMFGQSTEALRADPTSFLRQVHPDDRESVREAMERVSAGEPREVTYRVNTSPDVQLWVESRCKPVTDADGTVRYLVGFSRNITDRKRRVEDILETNERLDEFASLVAHDLRNPLGVASGRVELARNERESDHLATAARALSRINDLIDDLLELARQESTSVDPATARLGALAETSTEGIVMGEAELRVDDDPEIECDPVRVRELFENLFRNAIEHGGSEVTISVGRIAADEESGFYVADDGPGIPEAEREAVFEKGHSTNRQGTGFGLAIVRAIAQAHGWDISVTESADGGARFEVTGVQIGSA